MTLVVLLLIIGLLVGGLGLLLEGLRWLLIIGLILLVAGMVTGALSRGRRTHA